MKIHVRKFLKFWGYTIADTIYCWYPGCHARAVDIAHIDPKGMGGRDSVEYEENYCPLCRQHHNATEGRFKETLFKVVLKRIVSKFPAHDWSEKFKESRFFYLINEI